MTNFVCLFIFPWKTSVVIFWRGEEETKLWKSREYQTYVGQLTPNVWHNDLITVINAQESHNVSLHAAVERSVISLSSSGSPAFSSDSPQPREEHQGRAWADAYLRISLLRNRLKKTVWIFTYLTTAVQERPLPTTPLVFNFDKSEKSASVTNGRHIHTKFCAQNQLS
jgi:hypothetical protein